VRDIASEAGKTREKAAMFSNRRGPYPAARNAIKIGALDEATVEQRDRGPIAQRRARFVR
jgi:hypothetical protein